MQRGAREGRVHSGRTAADDTEEMQEHDGMQLVGGNSTAPVRVAEENGSVVLTGAGRTECLRSSAAGCVQARSKTTAQGTDRAITSKVLKVDSRKTGFLQTKNSTDGNQVHEDVQLDGKVVKAPVQDAGDTIGDDSDDETCRGGEASSPGRGLASLSAEGKSEEDGEEEPMDRVFRLYANQARREGRLDLPLVLMWACCGWRKGVVQKEDLGVYDIHVACGQERRWEHKERLSRQLSGVSQLADAASALADMVVAEADFVQETLEAEDGTAYDEARMQAVWERAEAADRLYDYLLGFEGGSVDAGALDEVEGSKDETKGLDTAPAPVVIGQGSEAEGAASDGSSAECQPAGRTCRASLATPAPRSTDDSPPRLERCGETATADLGKGSEVPAFPVWGQRARGWTAEDAETKSEEGRSAVGCTAVLRERHSVQKGERCSSQGSAAAQVATGRSSKLWSRDDLAELRRLQGSTSSGMGSKAQAPRAEATNSKPDDCCGSDAAAELRPVEGNFWIERREPPGLPLTGFSGDRRDLEAFSRAEKEAGNSESRQGNWSKAVQAWAWALWAAWSGKGAPDLRASLHLNLALGRLQLGEPREAAHHCDMLLTGELAVEVTTAQRVKAHYRRGDAYAALGRRAAAQGSFRAALSIDPGNREVQRRLEALLLQV